MSKNLFVATVCIAAGCVSLAASPAAAQSSRGTSIQYARLGYASFPGAHTRVVPAVTLVGYRHERDDLAFDVSALNFAYSTENGAGFGPSTWSLIRLAVFRLHDAEAARTSYAGAGLSLGATTLQREAAPRGYSTAMDGSGLQGELSLGYEFGRQSPMRAFLQADLALPFYEVYARGYSVRGASPVESSGRYAPSLTVSFGLGWEHGGHKRP